MTRLPRFAVYGGSFDPVHRGHLEIAGRLVELFDLDEFIFIPAFHAPHKKRLQPTSAIDRYAMLALATNNEANLSVSKMEIELPERPFTVETLTRLKKLLPDCILYFVMGADSWLDITTWRDWEQVLTMTNHIVVSRPGYDIDDAHVTDDIRDRIIDMRGKPKAEPIETDNDTAIYITDAVNIDISATDIRKKIRDKDDEWRDDLTAEVAKYIEKYQIYT